MDGNFSADVIIILAIGAFVLFKYRQILGHKTGHDVETPRKSKKEERVVQLHKYRGDAPEDELAAELLEPIELKDEAFEGLEEDKVREGIEKIKAIDEGFSLDEFLGGAKGAFEMVMDAFEKGQRDTLKMLLSEELYKEFDQELKSFTKAKQRPHTTLVSILSASPVEAKVQKSTAELTIRFLSEQIYIVKDDSGKVVDGDSGRIDQVEDEWVFERNLRSRNPNWTITEM